MKTAIILILILAMFIGCAPSVSMDKYTELETAYGDLRAQYDLQKAQYDVLQLNYGNSKEGYGVLEDKYNSLYHDWYKLSLENQALQAGLKQLEMNYNNLLAYFDKSVAQEKALSSQNAELEKMTQLYYEAVAKQEMKDWQSLAELQEFITEHKDEIVIQLLAGRDGAAQMDSQCVGKAMGLRELARKYHRNIEVQQLSPLEYARIFQRNISTHHTAVGLAIVAQADLYCIDTDYWDIKIAGYIP